MKTAPGLRLVLALPALLIALAVPATAQYRRAPSIDDMVDLVQVSSAQISPDGRVVLFTRSEIKSWKDNKRVPSIWIASRDGSDARPFLSSDKDRNPAWSPDGAHVAFLSTRDQPVSDRDAGPQIYLIRPDGGEAWKLTDHKGNIRSFEWSRDGGRIFFVSSDSKSDDEKAAEKSGDDAIFVDEGPNGQARGRYSSLWLVTIADKSEQKITKADLLIGSYDPSPDGRRIAITRRPDNARNGQFRSELAIVDVATGDVKALTRNDAPEGAPRWSPDGASIAYTAASDRVWDLAEDRLWLLPADGGAARRLTTEPLGNVGTWRWAPDGASIYFASVKNARGGLYQLDIANGRLRPIATGEWNFSLDSVTADLRQGAGTLSSPEAPADVHIVSLESGERTRVTTANPQAASLQMARASAVTWKSKDGLPIEGLLWLPPDHKPGTKLPLLVSVHGGPAGVWSFSFRGVNHVYSGMGWAVLEPNVRGSGTYGDALLRGNMRDIGGGDYQDLMTGVDTVIAQGIADENQLAIRGWSYGGILGGWTITQTRRFKAASLGALVSDWTSEYAMGFNHDVRLWYIGGTPWENPEGYRRQSASTHIAHVTTPTIIIHGEEDTTDTIGQSMIYYQGLKDRGVPVRFLRFPREPHGFREPHHQRMRDAEEISWLMRYARGIEWKATPRADEKDEKKKTTP